jgi:hypothetical protein
LGDGACFGNGLDDHALFWLAESRLESDHGLAWWGETTVIAPLITLEGHWVEVKDGDERVASIYRRHYSCHAYADNRRSQYGYRNRFLVMGPGEKLVLLSTTGDAILGWRKFIDQSGQRGINCAFFRNEGKELSSALLLDGEQHAWRHWPEEQRLYTYVNPKAIRSTNPGACFKFAGWSRCGETAGGLLILHKYHPGVRAIVHNLWRDW